MTRMMTAMQIRDNNLQPDRYDVTPKEYADKFSIAENTARTMFNQWLRDGKEFVTRTGKQTKRYPEGKPLRMSRNYFLTL